MSEERLVDCVSGSIWGAHPPKRRKEDNAGQPKSAEGSKDSGGVTPDDGRDKQ